MSDIDPAVASDSLPLAEVPPLDLLPDRPPFGVRLRRSVVDHNPFFLLSALCMLGGSVAVTNSLSWSPVRLERILWLTATINVYELLLVFLASILIRRPTTRRDGSILLIIEAFFLVDVAFLNAELFAIDRWVGLAANLVLFALALVKLAIVSRAVRVPMLGRELGVAASLLFLIYALPGILKFYATSRGGVLPAFAMLAVWWAIFAVGVAVHSLFTSPRSRPAMHWFSPLLSILAGISLLAHAGTSQWIYDQHFWGADLAPTLALVAFVLCSRIATREVGVVFAGAAVFASMSFGPHLRTSFLDHALTPIHLTSTVIYLVLAWTLARQFFAALVGIGVGVVLASLFGPPIATIRQYFAWLAGRVDDAVEFARPKTQAHWGVVSIATSFALLAIGALVSLKKREGNREST
jgi:hypothetical protein